MAHLLRSKVLLEVSDFLEAAATLGTQAEEAVKTCGSPVGNEVSLEVSDFLEAAATLGTQVGGVASVGAPVCPQVAAAAEGRGALGALVGFRTCVHH